MEIDGSLGGMMTIVGIVSIIAIICILVWYATSGEAYTNFKTEKIGTDSVTPVTSSSKDILSTGHVFVHTDQLSNYNYIYEFNLPIANGGDYNPATGVYNVYIGDTDSKEKLSKIGVLTRSPDGWSRFTFKSAVKYKFTVITYQQGSNEQTILSKDL